VVSAGLWLEAFIDVLVSMQKLNSKKISPKVMLKQYMDLEARLRCSESRGYLCELWFHPKLSQTNVVCVNPGGWRLPAHMSRSYPTSVADEYAKLHPLTSQRSPYMRVCHE